MPSIRTKRPASSPGRTSRPSSRASKSARSFDVGATLASPAAVKRATQASPLLRSIMSRMPGGGEQIQVKPTNNVYTALAAAAVIAQIIGLVVIYMRAQEIGGLW